MEILKDILFYTALGTGSICVISLLIVGTIRLFCIMLDHIKVANVLREALVIYVKQKRPDLKVEKEDIDFTKQRIYKGKKGRI